MSWYERLGVRRVINADARLTRLGGSIMPPEVVVAMAEAARWYVDLVELQRAVGRRLAELTKNEAAYVTASAAAGLTLATLACVTGPDPVRIARLRARFPDLEGYKGSGRDPGCSPDPVRPGYSARRCPVGSGRERTGDRSMGTGISAQRTHRGRGIHRRSALGTRRSTARGGRGARPCA